LLQKPLVDVRTDLNSLHEGILTGMQAIQEKVKHRVEVSIDATSSLLFGSSLFIQVTVSFQVANRRKLVETFLLCINRLEATESVLNASTGAGAAHTAEGGGIGETASSSARPSQRSRLLK